MKLIILLAIIFSGCKAKPKRSCKMVCDAYLCEKVCMPEGYWNKEEEVND